MSTGIGMPTAAAPTAYQHKDKDHSTTHSAVEEGVIIIRDKDKQQQDINTLSRDTQNANNELDPIFDKKKELDRIEKIELVADIASQAKDLAQKYSRMQAEQKYNALSPEEKDDINNKIRKELEGRGVDFSEYNEEGKQAVIRDEYIRQVSQREGIGNMGDGFSKGIDAATSIVIGIIKGDITGGLAGASAPYLATLIKEQTGHYDAASKTWITDNKAANLVAHAILGAVVAELQGNSGFSGGMGALTGEFAATYIREYLYNKKVEDLTEAEKRNISSLAQLASGLAVASVGGNTGDIAAAIASSKNAVENNENYPMFFNPDGHYMDIYNLAKKQCENDTICQNLSAEEQKEFIKIYTDDLYNKMNYMYLKGSSEFLTIKTAILSFVLFKQLPGGAIIGGTAGGSMNAINQYVTDGKVNTTDVIIWSLVGALTGGFNTGFGSTVGLSATGGSISNYLKGEDPIQGGLIGGSSAALGYGIGKLIQNPLQSIFNPAANKYSHEASKNFMGITGHFTENPIPSIAGTLSGSSGSELSQYLYQNYYKLKDEKKENE